MPVVSLQDRRVTGDRRAVSRTARATPAPGPRVTRRQVWTALVLYCAAFWGMVGYALYDIYGR